MLTSLKRKNNFTETSFTKRTKLNNINAKRKSNECNENNKKKVKIDHSLFIEETIYLIESGMCSRKMLDECKDRYLNYNKSKEMKEFLKLMEFNKKNKEDEMNLYKLVYKIEKSLLKTFFS